MKTLYRLTLYTYPNEDYREGFAIGVFRTEQEAEAVARRYLAEVKGFCEYECEPEILPTVLVGEDPLPETVWSWSGWNRNEDGDEVDILEGAFFPTEAGAGADMACAQQKSPRAEWSCDRWVIGRCEWSEGFVRYTYEA